MQHASPRPTRDRLIRGVDLTMMAAIALSIAFLATRTRRVDSPDLIADSVVADLGFVAIGVVLCLALWRQTRARIGVTRVASYLLAIVLCGMAYSRYGLLRYERLAEAPLTLAEASGTASRPSALQPLEAAEWAIRLGLHAASGRSEAKPLLMIPEGWPLPHGALFGVHQTPTGETELWARVVGVSATATCHATMVTASEPPDRPAFTPQCDTATTLPTGLVLEPPTRSSAPAAGPTAASGVTPWLQHRGTAWREAIVPADAPQSAGWLAHSHTQVRTGASVVGDLILLGGHGSGLLVAFDRATGARRWAVQLPNWIHQDPVSDGQVVVVGFGDNDRSFGGRAPSGVAAFDLGSGRRLWTEFEVSSVMTSPAILDSVVVYATSQGLLRERHLGTGTLLGTLQLPGDVVMGPPVLTGDTLVATLDGSRTCAVDLVPLRSLWCHQESDLRMLGHASAAIGRDVVVVSGVATATTPDIATFLSLPLALQAELVRALLFPAYLDYRVAHIAGQRFLGLELGTGRVVWRSPFFARRRLVDGHTAGTAALQDRIGIIVLPVADTVAAFDAATGAVRWTSGANQARGAPLIIGDQVIVAGRNGVIEVRRVADGMLTCSIRRDVGWDRAGPIATGNLLVFANLDGDVEAIPTSDLLTCRVADPHSDVSGSLPTHRAP